MQTQTSVNDKARNGLSHIAGVLGSITMIRKDDGRESGLTAKDQAVMTACCRMITEGLDEGAAATARVMELEAKLAEFETSLKDRDDKYAVLTGELDQLKAEIESLKRDAISDVVSSTYTPEVHEKFRDAAALLADANEYAKQDCVHLGGPVNGGARLHEKDEREMLVPVSGVVKALNAGHEEIQATKRSAESLGITPTE